MGKDLQGKVLPNGITQRKTGIYRGRFNYNGETYTRDNANLKELVQELEDLRYEVKHGLKGKGDQITLDAWFDVWLKDTESGKYTFKYQTPKTKNSIRKIPMQESVYQALKKQHVQLKEMQMASSDWQPLPQFNNLVFVGKNGKPITEHTFQVALNWIENSINKERLRIAEETKIPYEPIPHFYPHALRHTFATRCFEAGIDAKVVQGYLGHYSISITLDLYTHVTNDKAKTEMNKLEDYMKQLFKINCINSFRYVVPSREADEKSCPKLVPRTPDTEKKPCFQGFFS